MMSSSLLTLLPLLVALFTSLSVSPKPRFGDRVGAATVFSVDIDKVTGKYVISVNGEPFLNSAAYAFHVNNTWFSTKDGSLKLLAVTETKGSNVLGNFEETAFTWLLGATSQLVVTTIQIYDPLPFAIFNQVFLNGAENTAIGDNNEVISSYPGFEISQSNNLHYLSYRDTMSNAFTGVWGSGTYTGGPRGGSPLVLFNSKLDNIVISPLNNFMVGFQTVSKLLNQFACGIQGKVKSLPANFIHQTIISAGSGSVVDSIHYWGSLLLKLYGKPAKTVDDDFSVKYLGYWTDNGAYYYYNTENGKNYADTMVDVYNYINSINLPVKYYQYDSWWYFKGSTQGLLLWEPMPSVFPDGIASLQQKMGNTPIVLHNRWFESDTYYYTKMQYPFVVEGTYSIPLTEDPYVYMMSKAKEWGTIVYEQDWLVDQYLKMEITQNNVDVAKNWMLNMNNAALKVGLNMQLCMPLPFHVLQSVEMYSVTQIRASGDYQRQVYDNNQWALGFTSIFHHAIGIFPFKDCFWSNNATQPGCPMKEACEEPNSVLETLSALLSTGPVGPADKIGYLDTDNLLKTCRKDGILLKPDVPAQALDLVFSVGFSQDTLLYNLSHTYSRHQQISDSGVVNLAWHYLLAADTLIPFTVGLNDIDGTSDVTEFLYFDFFVGTDSLKKFDKTTPLVVPALTPTGKTVSFKYYVIFPIQSEDYSLIGETNKFAIASFQRFGDIHRSTASGQKTTTVKVYGQAGEKVAVSLYHARTAAVVQVVCIISLQGTSNLVCSDNGSTHSCTC